MPARDADGKLWSIQFVGDEGKVWIKDSRKAGTMHVVEPTGKGTLDVLADSRHGAVIVAEGYATASTIHEDTGRPVVVAFDCGNLRAVAEAVRAKFPDRPVLIAADNDHARLNEKGEKENIGVIKAGDAARAVGGDFVAPAFTAEEMAKGLTDFNDLGRARGKAAVGQAIEEAVAKLARTHRVAAAPDRDYAVAM